ETAKENLIREGIDTNSIFVTGNTVIDALFMILSKNPPAFKGLDETKRLILVTLHRRENWDKLGGILDALIELARTFPDIQILFPVHPNPNVNALAKTKLEGKEGFLLTDPMDYITFIATCKKAALIISDSGGIQEEAPSLKVPVLVVREFTERPEALHAGVSKLVGTEKENIFSLARSLLADEAARQKMIKEISPFGDGHAAKRIIDIISK
ncbi:MAG: non-hydrolyzing UDP-N-acetylglucosamine 2-epimerase, partial [Parachlamydiaceae bacterium]